MRMPWSENQGSAYGIHPRRGRPYGSNGTGDPDNALCRILLGSLELSEITRRGGDLNPRALSDSRCLPLEVSEGQKALSNLPQWPGYATAARLSRIEQAF